MLCIQRRMWMGLDELVVPGTTTREYRNDVNSTWPRKVLLGCSCNCILSLDDADDARPRKHPAASGGRLASYTRPGYFLLSGSSRKCFYSLPENFQNFSKPDIPLKYSTISDKLHGVMQPMQYVFRSFNNLWIVKIYISIFHRGDFLIIYREW